MASFQNSKFIIIILFKIKRSLFQKNVNERFTVSTILFVIFGERNKKAVARNSFVLF